MSSLQASAACDRPAPRVRCVRARASTSICSRSSTRVASKGTQVVFAVDLLANGKMTEQALLVSDASELVGVDVARPLGVVFAEQRRGSQTLCVVEELLPGSNAQAAGVRVGDVLRLTTCVVAVRGKVDVMSYYSNPPKASNRRALLVADAQPFGKLMKALVSNSEAVDLPGGKARAFDSIPLVMERCPAPPGAVS